MNGLRAGMSAALLMAAARVAAGVTSLTCHNRTFSAAELGGQTMTATDGEIEQRRTQFAAGDLETLGKQS